MAGCDSSFGWNILTDAHGGAVDRADRKSLARSSTILRQLEQRLQALPRLGEGWRFRPAVRSLLRRAGYGIRHGRCHHRQSPSPRSGRKRGTQNQAIGRSKGGMTTKILALTDALGNLVRFVLLPRPPFRYGRCRSADRRNRLRRIDRRQGLRQQCHHCRP